MRTLLLLLLGCGSSGEDVPAEQTLPADTDRPDTGETLPETRCVQVTTDGQLQPPELEGWEGRYPGDEPTWDELLELRFITPYTYEEDDPDLPKLCPDPRYGDPRVRTGLAIFDVTGRVVADVPRPTVSIDGEECVRRLHQLLIGGPRSFHVFWGPQESWEPHEDSTSEWWHVRLDGSHEVMGVTEAFRHGPYHRVDGSGPVAWYQDAVTARGRDTIWRGQREDTPRPHQGLSDANRIESLDLSAHPIATESWPLQQAIPEAYLDWNWGDWTLRASPDEDGQPRIFWRMNLHAGDTEAVVGHWSPTHGNGWCAELTWSPYHVAVDGRAGGTFAWSIYDPDDPHRNSWWTWTPEHGYAAGALGARVEGIVDPSGPTLLVVDGDHLRVRYRDRTLVKLGELTFPDGTTRPMQPRGTELLR